MGLLRMSIMFWWMPSAFRGYALAFFPFLWVLCWEDVYVECHDNQTREMLVGLPSPPVDKTPFHISSPQINLLVLTLPQWHAIVENHSGPMKNASISHFAKPLLRRISDINSVECFCPPHIDAREFLMDCPARFAPTFGWSCYEPFWISLAFFPGHLSLRTLQECSHSW